MNTAKASSKFLLLAANSTPCTKGRSKTSRAIPLWKVTNTDSPAERASYTTLGLLSPLAYSTSPAAPQSSPISSRWPMGAWTFTEMPRWAAVFVI
eukprot:scaffold379335_cov38-Prasinocladus_malaysianus.AAC.1